MPCQERFHVHPRESDDFRSPECTCSVEHDDHHGCKHTRDGICWSMREECLRHRLDHVNEKMDATMDEDHTEMLQQQRDFLEHLLKTQLDETQLEQLHTNNESASKLASALSISVNVVLLCLKIFVYVTTFSPIILASLLDSLLDLVSGAILFVASRWQKSKGLDQFEWPAGKSRIEPASIIMFSVLMAALSLQVITESISQLISSSKPSFDLLSLIIMSGIVVTKFILWVTCRRLAKKYESATAEALSQDHINDVISNTVGTALAYVASLWYWWLDPIGAILIAIWFIVEWLGSAFENIFLLVGRNADDSVYARLSFLILTCDERIEALSSLMIYSAGLKFIAEVEIVVPDSLSMQSAHDIGNAVYYRLGLEKDIERVFVHVCTAHSADPNPMINTPLAGLTQSRIGLTSIDIRGRVDPTQVNLSHVFVHETDSGSEPESVPIGRESSTDALHFTTMPGSIGISPAITPQSESTSEM